ncbi:MAG: hypothetical protein RJA19_152 [Bacteroidota bacterium]
MRAAWGRVRWATLGLHVLALLLFGVLAEQFYSPYHEGWALRQGDLIGFSGMSKEVTDHKILTGEHAYWTDAMFGGMPTYQITGQTSEVPNLGGLFWRLAAMPFSSREIAVLFMAMLSAYLLALALRAGPWGAMMVGVGYGLASLNILYLGAGHETKVHAIAMIPGVIAGLVGAFRGNRWWGALVTGIFLVMHISANHLQITYYLFIFTVLVGIFLGVEAVVKQGWASALSRTGILLIVGLGAVLPNLAILQTTKDYSDYTTRGQVLIDEEERRQLMAQVGLESPEATAGAKEGEGLSREYILEYSMGRGEWLAILSPNLKGGGDALYWGEQSFSAGAIYFGAILCAFFFAFLFAGKSVLRWPLALVFLLAVLTSWREGNALLDFCLDYVPLFNKFRDTKMMLVIAQAAVAAGVALMVSELMATGALRLKGGKSELAEWARARNRYLLAFGGVLAVCLGFYMMPEVFFDFTSEIRPDRIVEEYGVDKVVPLRLELFREDMLRTLFLVCVASLGAVALIYRWGPPAVALVVLVGATTVDVWQVSRRYNNEEGKNGQRAHWIKADERQFPHVPSAQQLIIIDSTYAQAQATDPQLAEREQRLLAEYKNRLPGGRSSKRIEPVMELAAKTGAMRFSDPFRVLNWDNPYSDASFSYHFQSVGGYHGAKLRRYQDFADVVLARDRKVFVERAKAGDISGGMDAMVGHRMLNMRYMVLSQLDRPLRVPNPSGPAWFAQAVRTAQSDADELGQTAELSSLDTAVVHQEFAEILGEVGPPGVASIQQTSYQPEKITYATQSEQKGLVVFSEVWYPAGWKLKLDGAEIPLIRVNYLLRGAVVPAGEHQLEMSFEPDLSATERFASLGAYGMGCLLLIAMGLGLGSTLRKTE